MSKLQSGFSKEALSKFLAVFRAIGNKERLDILISLCDGSKTWNEFIYDLRINPKSLRDHLKVLQEAGLVRKHKPNGFELTEFGVSVLGFLARFVENLSAKEVEGK